jgi:hypothetical protein
MFASAQRNRGGNFGFRRSDLTFRRVLTAAFVGDEQWWQQFGGPVPYQFCLNCFMPEKADDSRIKVGVNSTDTVQRRGELRRPSDDHTPLCASSRSNIYSNLFPGRLRNGSTPSGKIPRTWGNMHSGYYKGRCKRRRGSILWPYGSRCCRLTPWQSAWTTIDLRERSQTDMKPKLPSYIALRTGLNIRAGSASHRPPIGRRVRSSPHVRFVLLVRASAQHSSSS